MPNFKVSVEKRLYCTGTVEVTADNAEEAVKKVDDQINSGDLQTSSVDTWDDPEYEDCSFQTTGDVD
jgi:hypothetical protein